MANWRLANNLITLRDQFDALAPERDTSSDGTIGDAAHAARASDHNPNSDGVVAALDITHDPAHGVDTYQIAEQLRLSKDDRIKYVISNRRIFGDVEYARRNGVEPWTWSRYNGSNPHDHHMHVSVDIADRGSQDPWPIKLTAPTGGVTPKNPTLRRGAKGERVAFLQNLLAVNRDGVFGPSTERAVRNFQAGHGLVVDGAVGPYTWEALLKGEPPKPLFRSLVPGGFFSSDPFDASVNTSIRTNNPGALNVADWVKKLPGYVGDKVTSWSGASPNSTVIFETPEDGVAAWLTLMEHYAARGADTVKEIIDTYGGKGQDYSDYVDFVVKRTGWGANHKIALSGNDIDLMAFARAMFRYEGGKESPLKDTQILLGFQLARGEIKRDGLA